jgi:cobalt-zinc-cadmium efflux system outer membrane protein
MMQKVIKPCRVILPAVLVLSVLPCRSQTLTDTVRYSQPQAEKIFLENNVPLLAAKLDISQADARILQAKAWPNPSFSLSDIQLFTNASANESPPLFGNFWTNRTFGAQLEQLVYTARKRKKGISLETRNKELAENAFAELLWALKAEFRQAIAELVYAQRIQDDLLFQQAELDHLVKAQQAQFMQGNIAQTALYRLKALQISLKGDINGLQEQITEKQKNLKILMAADPKSYLVFTTTVEDADIVQLKGYTLDALLSLSQQHNTGLRLAASERLVSEAQLTLEQARRVPDLVLGVHYDRNSSTLLNFIGAGITMDLPVFNRNKGNIRAAALELQKTDLLYRNKMTETGNTVVKAWSDLHNAIGLYEAIDKDYIDKLSVLTKGIVNNYKQRNMSLLEFLDFFESFRESRGKYYEAIKNIELKKEDLSYLTGTDL